MRRTITVKEMLAPTRAAAERGLRLQLKDMADAHGLKLKGRPDLEVEEVIPGFWNGAASQTAED